MFELGQEEYEEASNMNSWGKAGADEGNTKAPVWSWGPAESKTNKDCCLGEVYLWWGYLDSSM